MRRIFLIGYMGSGKTTVGEKLAEKLNLPFIDTDLFIESRYKKKIIDIFVEKKEEKFRIIEQEILQEIIRKGKDAVISTGGGTPCFFHNMELMNISGTTVYLKIATKLIIERLVNMKYVRPLIKDKSPEEIEHFVINNLAERELFYNQASIIYSIRDRLESLNDIVENLIPKI